MGGGGDSPGNRSKARYSPIPGDITFVVPVELLAKATFAVDASGKFIQVQYPDNIQPAWPSPDVARRGDVLVAVDGRSTLLRKSFPKILMYLNQMRNRKAYELTFRLPQVALDARPPLSTRTQFDPRTGNVEGYLNKLSRGGLFTKPKWEIRYFVIDPSARVIRRYKTRVNMNDPKAKAIALADVARVTENVPQPDPDEADSSAVVFAGSSFVTRFDLHMKDSTTRSFICFTPEDSRVWVSLIAMLINQNVMTEQPLAPNPTPGEPPAADGGDVGGDGSSPEPEAQAPPPPVAAAGAPAAYALPLSAPPPPAPTAVAQKGPILVPVPPSAPLPPTAVPIVQPSSSTHLPTVVEEPSIGSPANSVVSAESALSNSHLDQMYSPPSRDPTSVRAASGLDSNPAMSRKTPAPAVSDGSEGESSDGDSSVSESEEEEEEGKPGKKPGTPVIDTNPGSAVSSVSAGPLKKAKKSVAGGEKGTATKGKKKKGKKAAGEGGATAVKKTKKAGTGKKKKAAKAGVDLGATRDARTLAKELKKLGMK